MSDLWEDLHGFSTSDDGTLTPAQAPTADPDGDGMTNLSESISATNPLSGTGSSGSFRASLAPSATLPGNLELSWPQLKGKVYQPQSSSNLSVGSWVSLGDSTVATAAGVNRLTVPQNGNRSFLRVWVDDVDQDGDTLTSWEEGLLNTNPKLPDTDGDGVDDNLERFYGSDPTTPSDGGVPQPIPAAPAGQLKVRLFVTTFLGQTYPSTNFLTPFSVKVFKKNVSTGAETLAHVLTYTGAPPFAVSTANLPNDGSIYTIQAEMPDLSSSSLVAGFKDFSFLISATPDTGSAPFVAVNGFDPATNTLGSVGHILGTPARIYSAAYTAYRAVISPIILEKVISDQIAGNEANQLPTRAFGKQPNNPMVTATRTGTEARFKIRANVWPTVSSKVLVAARDVAAGTILGSTPIIPLPLLTSLTFNATDGTRLYEIVAGVDDNSNGTLETGEVKTIFEKTPRVNTDGTAFTGSVAFLDKIRIVTVNDYSVARAATEGFGGLPYSLRLPIASKLITAFSTGSKIIDGAGPTTYGHVVSANGIGTPAARGLSLPLGATWDSNNQATTHRFNFPDGSDLSKEIKASKTMTSLIKRLIVQNRAELQSVSVVGSWTYHVILNLEDKQVDFDEDAKTDMAYGIGKCNFKGSLEVETTLIPGGLEVRFAKINGEFDDLYDFSWPGKVLKAFGFTVNSGEATKTQAGNATLPGPPHPEAGKIFYTKVTTLNATRSQMGKFIFP